MYMNKALNPTWKNFFHFALPSMAAMVIFSSYTIIDGIFVAKGVSDLAMAAVNLSLPFINVLSGLAVLLTMGTSTLCAFALGKGDQKKAEELFTQTVVVILIVSAVISVAVSIFAKPLAYLLGARELTIGYSSQYLHVVCLFSVCVILSYCLEVMVKVDGRPQLAMIGMAISFVSKLKNGQVLDAVFEEVTWWVVFAGLGLMIVGITPIVLVIGMVMVVAGPMIQNKGFGKVTGIFGSLYNHVTGYFGDILSYSRLMALMLAGSVIAQVFNTLGAIPGNIVIFLIISFAGNALNFALNLLGCYVHDLRLQCLEYFGKFYQDGGKPFRPLDLNTKYYEVVK